MKIYLAGALTNLSYDEANKWRKAIKENLEAVLLFSGQKECEIINPLDYYNYNVIRHKSEKEVMQYDLNHVRNSDLIIVSLKNINSSIGTAIELYVASQLNIPVLAVGTDMDYESAHPWLKECISRFENSIGSLLDYLLDFYFK